MKKIFFTLLILIIGFIIIKNPFNFEVTIDGALAFSNMVMMLMYFLLAFWLWGQIFVIHTNVVSPLFFLILKGLHLNIQITIFAFAIFLLFFEQAYISKELLVIYLAIINFFPVLKKSDNEEYIKASIKLIGLSIFIFIDIFSIKSSNLTFQYIMNNKNINMILLALSFIKTLVHSSFYAILFSCFYMSLKDFFYKDEEITYLEIFKNFLENMSKYSNY